MKLYLIFDKIKLKESGMERGLDYSKAVDKYLDVPIWHAYAIKVSSKRKLLQDEARPYVNRYVAKCELPGAIFTFKNDKYVNLESSMIAIFINMLTAYHKTISPDSKIKAREKVDDIFRLNKCLYFKGYNKEGIFFEIGIEIKDTKLHLKYKIHKGIHKEEDAGIVKNDFVKILTKMKKIINLIETI